jgi:hypothetical protein
MRTVSFSDRSVQSVLNRDFVCCYSNTKGDPSAGSSFSHSPNDQPGPCGRGAGRQNVQTIFMTPAGEIFHVATGYLGPTDLLNEADFARRLYAGLPRNYGQGQQFVFAAHQSQLRRLGFTRQEIEAPETQLDAMMLSGPNPQDFGINMPRPQNFGASVSMSGPHAKLFGDVAKQRMLNDHKFVMAHPLLKHQDFERNPGALVGHHRSFFGTHSAMNGMSQHVNQQANQRASAGTRR